MKTLILSGSPRRHGDSMALLEELRRHLRGSVDMVSAYYDGIGPCIDCRHCWKHAGCSIDDGMQRIYDNINVYDHVVIASPLYMSELTGPLLGVASRLQVYYAAKRFRGETLVHKRKGGALLLTGGGDGSPDPAIRSTDIIFRLLKATCLARAISHNTNSVAAGDDPLAMLAARDAAKKLNDYFEGTALS